MEVVIKMTEDHQPRTAAQRQFDQLLKAWERSRGASQGHYAGLLAVANDDRTSEVATDLAALRETVAEWRNLQIGDAKHFHDRLRAIERALESPASAPETDPMCPKCEYRLEKNCLGQWQCYGCGEHGRHLNPEWIVPTQAEPATAHQEPPDPVRGIMPETDAVMAVLPSAPRVDVDAVLRTVIDYGASRETSGYYRRLNDEWDLAVLAETVAGDRYSAIRAMLEGNN